VTSKQGGSLPKGRRLREEVPDVPPRRKLSPVERRAQRVLRSLVEEAGGRFESRTAVPSGGIEELMALFEGWARGHAVERDGRACFGGEPGLWHALDELYPLQDPNRWDGLRKEVISELEARGWERVSPPRGSTFLLP